MADGKLLLSDGCSLRSPHPVLIGRRQRHVSARVSARVDASAGAGGLVGRYDETSWFALSVRESEGVATIIATASLSGLRQSGSARLPMGEVELRFDMAPPSPEPRKGEMLGGERIRLSASSGDQQVLLTKLDGRYWSGEVCVSFTGRLIGLFSEEGTVAFSEWRYRGWEGAEAG